MLLLYCYCQLNRLIKSYINYNIAFNESIYDSKKIKDVGNNPTSFIFYIIPS